MSVLPSRDRARKVLTEPEVKEIVEAWRSGELETAAEWRETIDYDVAIEFAKAIGLLALLGDSEFDSDEATADQLRWVIDVAVTGKTEAKGGRWLDAALSDKETTDDVADF